MDSILRLLKKIKTTGPGTDAWVWFMGMVYGYGLWVWLMGLIS
jgi:hypothetical protein